MQSKAPPGDPRERVFLSSGNLGDKKKKRKGKEKKPFLFHHGGISILEPDLVLALVDRPFGSVEWQIGKFDELQWAASECGSCKNHGQVASERGFRMWLPPFGKKKPKGSATFGSQRLSGETTHSANRKHRSRFQRPLAFQNMLVSIFQPVGVKGNLTLEIYYYFSRAVEQLKWKQAFSMWQGRCTRCEFQPLLTSLAHSLVRPA